MFRTLARTFSRRPPEQGREGFVYVSREEAGAMRQAREGAILRSPGRGPPWIVVAHSLSSVVVARWPGRLWRVKVVEAATARDQKRTGGPPRPGAGYTRAIAVEILREEDAWTLFGARGRNLVPVFDAAAALDREQALRLGSARHPQAPLAVDRAWRAWMTESGIPLEGRGSFDGVLYLGATDAWRPATPAWPSPVNQGLSALHHVVFTRAVALDGKAARATDEDDDGWLAPPWDGAVLALLDAALALGAPAFVGEADREILTHAWAIVCR
jgi:hypothetical protein